MDEESTKLIQVNRILMIALRGEKFNRPQVNALGEFFIIFQINRKL